MNRTRSSRALILLVLSGLSLVALEPLAGADSAYPEALSRIMATEAIDGGLVSVHSNNRNGQSVTILIAPPDGPISETCDREIVDCLLGRNLKLIMFTTSLPTGYGIVKDRIAEPMLYGGEIRALFSKVSFEGWFRIAGAIDRRGRARPGYEAVATQKKRLVESFGKAFSQSGEGSYVVIDLINEGKKSSFRFYRNSDDASPFLDEDFDLMVGRAIVRMNLVENPEDPGVSDDLLKPIRASGRMTLADARTDQDERALAPHLQHPATSIFP